MSSALHFAGLSGSLRKGSFNTSLLRACAGLLPGGVTFELVPIDELPHYNADLDVPASTRRPASVDVFRERLAKADAFVFVSPEYNYSIPGPLKNAIDWASRGQDSPMVNKTAGLMGASPGLWGTVRMQLAFHAVFQYLNIRSVYKPEVLVNQADKKFDTAGNLTDDATRNIVKQHLENLKALTLQLKAENV